MKVLSHHHATIAHRREIVLVPVRPATPEPVAADTEAMRLRDHRWVAPPGCIPEHDYCMSDHCLTGQLRRPQSGKFVPSGRAIRH